MTVTAVESVHAELAFLGCILIEGHLIKETNIDPNMFQSVENQIIFNAMKTLNDKGRVIDLVTLTTELSEDFLSRIGGVSYLGDLASSVPSTATFKHYERIIIENYKMRESKRIVAKYLEGSTEQDLDDLQNKLQTLQEIGSTNEEKTMKDLLLEIADEINGDSADVGGYNTNFYDYDSMTGGLRKTDLIVVAARPSMGKTAFALNLGSNHCQHNNGTSHVFTLEMPGKQLVKRLISSVGLLDGAKWHNPTQMFGDEDYEKAINAMGIISEWDFRIHENIRTIGDIRSRVRGAVKREKDKKHLVIIDYLQLISGGMKFENRVQEVGYITRELKLLAKELEIPIVLLSQLSRNVEQRQDKRPLMSDLRESGNIEQDADVVCFLYRDDYYDKESEKQNITEIIISKQRNGPVGTIELAFFKEYGKFQNLVRRFEEV